MGRDHTAYKEAKHMLTVWLTAPAEEAVWHEGTQVRHMLVGLSDIQLTKFHIYGLQT